MKNTARPTRTLASAALMLAVLVGIVGMSQAPARATSCSSACINAANTACRDWFGSNSQAFAFDCDYLPDFVVFRCIGPDDLATWAVPCSYQN